ncbi:MAG TPA: GNAT family N-acetyltransferase [Pyrinomonadaceae bacterium]|nr:GNAT family N-acetyltransferase [Pyrinomonadaceae bacterium]
MAVTMMCQDWESSFSNFRAPVENSVISELCRDEETEVIEFLSARPIHTVFMTGLIRDNGMLSPRNRGSFYGSRNNRGQLDGVALIGHATLVEARTENSLKAFACVARNCRNAHLIRGEQSAVKTFWQYYAGAGREPRQICRELMFEMKKAPAADHVADLRPATVNELEKVVAVNSAMAFEEAGINPLQRDPNGFRNRTARRIEKQRVWVVFEDNRLIFKADVVSETPQVSYLEGIYVHPEERGQGHGSRCLRKLCSQLLNRSQSLSVTVNYQNKRATAFYEKAGFEHHSDYETIYLR